MIQLQLFPPALVKCETCEWSWREGDQPPPDHAACTAGEGETWPE